MAAPKLVDAMTDDLIQPADDGSVQVEPLAAESTTAASSDRRPLGTSYRKLLTATTLSNLGDGIALIAYTWLASAVTRNPLLIALITAAQRLPWLLFSVPAGVITDRVDRRKAIVLMDSLRFAVTLLVAFTVLQQQDALPSPDDVQDVTGTRTGLYLVLVLATLCLGMAEVLRDNCGQTLMPSLVDDRNLERANGRLWSAEVIAHQFIGPPLGTLLLLVGFAVPFFIDAASFFVSAALIALIPGVFRAQPTPAHASDAPADAAGPARTSWRQEAKEGVSWLRAHPLLWPMAKILGVMNLAMMMSGSIYILYAQEVMNVGTKLFTVVGFGAAIGGVIGGAVASYLSNRFGSGTCLSLVLVAAVANAAIIGLVPLWPVVFVMFGVIALSGTLWNVITVSLRQSIIPSHLLGRVNSVYRFLAWGGMPIGAALGGATVWFLDQLTSREWALRGVWFVDAAIHVGLFFYARSRLTTDRIDAARRAGRQALTS
jgi:MFS family permease